MATLGLEKHMTVSSKFIIPSLISCVFVFLSQFALAMIPRYFASYSLIAKLALSALLLLVIAGFGRFFRRLVGVYASAPAFVLFNTLFIWGVYIVVVRQAISYLTDIVFNVELALLMIGLYSIICSDPGLVIHGYSCLEKFSGSAVTDAKPHSKEKLSGSVLDDENPTIETEEVIPFLENSSRRVRFCKHCKAYIKGFDHHCPAFGNCIGKKNHVLFMVLLVGFIFVEASYIVCFTRFTTRYQLMDKTGLEFSLSSNFVISTMIFTLLQMLWQINWRKYPEFHLLVQCQEHASPETKFRNPYDKGVLGNIMEFLTSLQYSTSLMLTALV
ncbi:PREDICTED: probable palmitoyltransferase ZDHHC12 isoform X2 [Nelumbo nucifera]|uniref:S-acyltransferase n=1 Tax=Nelumbo nucifera TaxID=4432 RepID=A0A1U7ZJB1_NELNU|nr:PREDICTED: probable palmitoyltransferase ZDHHC12 isoform X2 [Nelumbo nucifera]